MSWSDAVASALRAFGLVFGYLTRPTLEKRKEDRLRAEKRAEKLVAELKQKADKRRKLSQFESNKKKEEK